MKQFVFTSLLLSSLIHARPVLDSDSPKRAPPFIPPTAYGQNNLQSYLQSLGYTFNGAANSAGNPTNGAAMSDSNVSGFTSGFVNGESGLGQNKALAGAVQGSQSSMPTNPTGSCPTSCLSCDANGQNCVCNCSTAQNLGLVQGAILPTVESAITNATNNLDAAIQNDLATLPCAQVPGLQNPSFERSGGELDGWDIYIQPPNSTNSYVQVDSTYFFRDSYSGINTPNPQGHSAHITVKGGEIVEMFNVVPNVCPGASIFSAIQVMTTDPAPTCNVYFGMVPALNNPTIYYPVQQTSKIQSLFTAAGGVGKWFNLTQNDTMNADTTSGALVFAVDCNSTAYTSSVANYWIDYAFFYD